MNSFPNISTHNRNSNSASGFSLVELMICLAVLGIVAAISSMLLSGALKGVDEKLAKTQLHDIAQGEESYKTDLNMGKYATLAQLRKAKPGGKPVINPELLAADGTPISYKGWVLEQAENPTVDTYFIKMMPVEGNNSANSYFVYEDGVVRQTSRTGPWQRSE